MTTRSIQQIFEQYEKCRLNFVKTISELALRSTNIPILNSMNVLEILRPLLNDTSKQIQQNTTIAIGRILQGGPEVAKQITNFGTLANLLKTFSSENKYQKVSIFFVLRSICKHDATNAQLVINSGGFDVIIQGFEDVELSVKESAAWVAGYIASHNETLAQLCVDNSLIPHLILCLQEASLTLKRIAIGALSDIAKHNPELAQNVVDAGAIPYFASNLQTCDAKLKKQVLYALSSCAKHKAELAEVVVETDIFPTVFLNMAHPNCDIRRNATILLRDIVKHSLELTQLIVNCGGIGALSEQLNNSTIESRIPCITAIGFIAGHCEQLALTVLASNILTQLTTLLNDNDNVDDNLLSVIVWTLGQIGKHSSEHSKAVACANLFIRIINLYNNEKSSEDLKYKCKVTLKLCLQKCLLLDALEPLLYEAPSNILKYILAQYSKVLPNDSKARRLFVTSGGLKKIQLIQAKPGTTLMEYINAINSCFPDEIVRYFSPGYPETLLEKVEQYSPQIMTVLREPYASDSDIQTHITAMLDQKMENLLTD